jgi:hypothetical protein
MDPKREADPVEAIATKGDWEGKLKSVIKGETKTSSAKVANGLKGKIPKSEKLIPSEPATTV